MVVRGVDVVDLEVITLADETTREFLMFERFVLSGLWNLDMSGPGQ